MFSDELNRLLREDWPNATMLAQELYALLGSVSIPTTLQGATTITSNPGQTIPAMTINLGSPGQTAIQINPADGGAPITIGADSINFPPLNGLGSTELDGSPSYGPININANLPSQQPSQTLVGGTSGGGLMGQVVSGTGNLYTVQLYQGNVQAGAVPAATGLLVTVTQLLIDQSQTIPSGTPCVVVKIGTSYVMQVPVFL